MKKILLLATGGTIASKPTGQGLAPSITSEELLAFVPELGEICHVEARQLFSLDSTNVYQPHWKAIAQTVKEHYEHYDGFVVAHCTDTMAYTAAALTYMIQNSRKPVVLTGSQKSIYNRDSDARNNLIKAFLYAVSDEAWGVHIAVDNKVILGTRARKVRTKSFNAFDSIDFPETAVFSDHRLIQFMPTPEGLGEPEWYFELDPGVFVVRLVPGMSSEVLSWLQGRCRAVVVEGFGVGGLPLYGDESFTAALRKWVEQGGLAVLTTQVPHEGSDLGVYAVGSAAKDLPGVVEARNMTQEAIVVKLMWALGPTQDREEVLRLFTTPICHDIL